MDADKWCMGKVLVAQPSSDILKVSIPSGEGVSWKGPCGASMTARCGLSSGQGPTIQGEWEMDVLWRYWLHSWPGFGLD